MNPPLGLVHFVQNGKISCEVFVIKSNMDQQTDHWQYYLAAAFCGVISIIICCCWYRYDSWRRERHDSSPQTTVVQRPRNIHLRPATVSQNIPLVRHTNNVSSAPPPSYDQVIKLLK